mmetsp:Transcript_79558/g.125601  ORF Transcript_79558/g.125601 Transcript_79558/m.125601 type:complete len:302 (-) Transcript_79558:662-1567(-)
MVGLQFATRQIAVELNDLSHLVRRELLASHLKSCEIHILPAGVDHLGELSFLIGIVGHGNGDRLQHAAEGVQGVVEFAAGHHPQRFSGTIQDHLRSEENLRSQVPRFGAALTEQRPVQRRHLRQGRESATGRPIGLFKDGLQRFCIDQSQTSLQQVQGFFEISSSHQITGQTSLFQPFRLATVTQGQVQTTIFHMNWFFRQTSQITQVQITAPVATTHVTAQIQFVLLVGPARRSLGVFGHLLGIQEGLGARHRGRRSRFEAALLEDLLGGHQQRPIGRISSSWSGQWHWRHQQHGSGWDL